MEHAPDTQIFCYLITGPDISETPYIKKKFEEIKETWCHGRIHVPNRKNRGISKTALLSRRTM